MKTGNSILPFGRVRDALLDVYNEKDKLWLAAWFLGIGALWLWDSAFLHRPAFDRLQTAFVNTLLAGTFVVLFSSILGWSLGVTLYFMEKASNRIPYLVLTFALNLIRSIPQIVGILIGYVVITIAIEEETLRNQYYQLASMAIVISVFVFLEVVDLIRERVSHYKKLDFFPAMLCCGIKEGRIINIEILWKNSMTHLVHKLISIFGITIFLQCSIDFILSVGLFTDVSSSNFPVTLGSLLAKMDSKQDVLAIGTVFSGSAYFKELFVQHLQGISVAFVIVFSLLCIYQISNGFVKRLDL
jgi:ABC-type methionine transport system permease subunit